MDQIPALGNTSIHLFCVFQCLNEACSFLTKFPIIPLAGKKMCSTPGLFFIPLGSLFIHLWQNTHLPPSHAHISLSRFIFYSKSTSSPFHKFSLPLTTSPLLPDGLFLKNFQHNLAVIDGGVGLTTCLWVRGIASTSRRIFFWKGVN